MWQIDRFARVPIYEQMVALVERYVMQGVLKVDEQMPSVRALSRAMSVNPNTLQKAYAELERRGICYAVPGSGRFIRAEAKQRLEERKNEQFEDLGRLVAELFAAGVDAEEMVRFIRAVAKERENA